MPNKDLIGSRAVVSFDVGHELLTHKLQKFVCPAVAWIEAVFDLRLCGLASGRGFVWHGLDC